MGPAGYGAVQIRRRPCLEGRPIHVYNHGNMKRDFTFVEDLVEAMAPPAAAGPARRPARRLPAGSAHDSLSPVAAWRVVNIGAEKAGRI